MAAGDLFCNGKAKSASVLILMGLLFVEPVEDVGDVFRQDAAAAVGDGQGAAPFFQGHVYSHVCPGRGEFDGIVEDNRKHLPEAAVISAE